MESVERQVELGVPPALAGARLDRALVELVARHVAGAELSRSRLAALVRAGRVRVDGAVETRPGAPLEAGQRLSVALPPTAPTVDAAEARARLPLLFADEALAVVDKPAGMLTHRAEGGLEPSVADYAVALFGPLPSAQGEDRPGIVHRLDRDTSGALALGLDAPALAELLRQFREREVEKGYLALVHGVPRFDSDWIEAPLGRSRRNPERITVRPEGEGREARTFYEVRERFDGLALVACRPVTGRTHQIRVHLASIGHPVCGDAVYRPRGGGPGDWPPDLAPPARQLLHAARLVLAHPRSGERLTLEAPLPADLSAVLAALRARG